MKAKNIVPASNSSAIDKAPPVGLVSSWRPTCSVMFLRSENNLEFDYACNITEVIPNTNIHNTIEIQDSSEGNKVLMAEVTLTKCFGIYFHQVHDYRVSGRE